MQINTFPYIIVCSIKPGLPVGFPRQPLGLLYLHSFPGNDTFHFEHVKGGKQHHII